MASRRRENPYLFPKNAAVSRTPSKDNIRFISKKQKSDDEDIAIYKQMLEHSGLKIHPKQLELLSNKSVQQLIRGDDDKFDNLMRKASTMQKDIQYITNKAGDPMSPGMKDIIEDNIKQEFAKQIAKEISQNLKVTYSDNGVLTPSKKKKAVKKANTFIRKQTFNTMQKVSKTPIQTKSGVGKYSMKSKNPFLNMVSPGNNLRSVTSLNAITSFADNDNRDRFNINIELSSQGRNNEEELRQPPLRESVNHESDLTERMKKMSVYDLYTMTKKQDTVLIDAFIKKSIIGETPNRPGVAPQVKTNNFVIEEKEDEESKVVTKQNSNRRIYEEGALQESYGEFKQKIKNSGRNQTEVTTPRTPKNAKTTSSGSEKRKYLTSINKRYMIKQNSPLRTNLSQTSLTSKNSPQHLKNTSQMTFGDNKRNSYQTFNNNKIDIDNSLINVNMHGNEYNDNEPLFYKKKNRQDIEQRLSYLQNKYSPVREKKPEVVMESKTEITMFENVTQTMAQIKDQQISSSQEANQVTPGSRRCRKTRSTQRMRQASEEANTKIESTKIQNPSAQESEDKPPTLSTSSQFQALINQRINPSLIDVELPKKSKSPNAHVPLIRNTPVQDQKANRPKSSGLLISSSQATIHRVKYTPTNMAKSKLPKQIEAMSSGEKNTGRDISFYANTNPLAKSMISNEKMPFTIFDGAAAAGSSDDGANNNNYQQQQLNKEIRQMRVQLKQNLTQINFILLNEVEYIKRPQKYMIFAGKLFKILFDLVSQTQYYSHQNTRKKNKQSINKDIIDEESINTDQDADLENQIISKIQAKFFMQAEVELRRLSALLTTTFIRDKEYALQQEKDLQNEWQFHIKPFLAQNNMVFQNSIQSMAKQLKKLIESNEKSKMNLQQIETFSQKVLNFIQTHQNLANLCTKTGKSGSLFMRIFDVVRLASHYAVKKCRKEMSKDPYQSPIGLEEFYPEPSFDQDPNPLEPFKIALIPVEYTSEATSFERQPSLEENVIEQEETFVEPRISIEPMFSPPESEKNGPEAEEPPVPQELGFKPAIFAEMVPIAEPMLTAAFENKQTIEQQETFAKDFFEDQREHDMKQNYQEMFENLHEQMTQIEEYRDQNYEKPPTFRLDESLSEKKKRVGISNLKTKKKKPDFGLYHPNTGIPLYFPYPDQYEDEEFRINLSRVFCRRQDFIKAKLESQPHQQKQEDQENVKSGETIVHEVRVRQRIGTRNDDEELEAISRSFAGNIQNPFKKLMMGSRSKSIVEQ